ncbi:DNA repair protein rad18, partial [Lojkania enalia]
MDPSFDLPDPTDWLPTRLPSFEPLEASLRCEVCKEFYNDPVITSCAHTFCSLCIRRCLTADSKCPTCRAPNSSDKLMVNLVVREIVKKFQEARPKALELARRKDGDKPRKEAGARKRKLDDTDIEEGESVRQSRARLTRSRKGVDGWQSTPIEIVDTDDEDSQEFIPEDVPEGMVKCPICQTPMKEEQVFPHLNDCPDAPADQKAGSVRNTRSKSNTATLNPLQRRQRDLSPAQTRLPQLNYHLLKEGGLRKKLQELGIPSGGKKELLAQRHTEWLHLWNSNCDSDAPRSKRELLQDLAVWERTRGAITSAAESKFMRKDFDVQRHATMHKSQFDDLIANARRKRDAL